MKILWASPLPPFRSGVSDYAIEILEALGSRARVRVVEPPGWEVPKDWPLGDAVELVPTGAQAAPDEVSLLHLGNNPHHLWLLERLGRPRTAVVLHDLVLHHLLVEAAAADATSGSLEERLSESHGAAGAALASAREVGFTGRRDPFLFPALKSFLKASDAVIVHSRWARERVRNEEPALPVGLVGLPARDPGVVDRTAIRHRLGLEDHDLVLMHLGFLTPEKGLLAILGGVAAAVRAGVAARLVLVGQGASGEGLVRAAKAAGVGDRVVATGWIEPVDFPSVPAAADLGVVLRTPSAGETSAAAVRFLACGTPVAVGGRRQFLEFPEAAAPRLTPGPSASAELARLLATAAEGGAGWAARRRAARQTYEDDHTPERAADQLLAFLTEKF
ncbi:MAG: glycosyltransferase [Acidobacteriota bacterium]|nr:glycosyltransferase [Acidobacteriota bacterium]